VDGNNYQCYIQEMAPQDGPCLVFVEELGEKVTVPFEALKTLPVDELKPWTPAYHGRNNHFYGGGDYFQKYRGRRRYPFVKSFESIMMDDEKPNRMMYSSLTYKASSTTSSEIALKQYTSTRHFQPPPYEQYAMPLVFGDNVKNAKPLMDCATSGQSGDKGDKGGKNAGGSGHNNNNRQHQDGAAAENKDKQQQQQQQQPPMGGQYQQPPPPPPPPQPMMEVPAYQTPLMYNGSGPSFLYPAYGYPTTPNCDQQFFYEPPAIINGTCYYPNQPTAQSPHMGAMPGFYTVPPPPPPPQNMQPPYGYAMPGPAVAASPAYMTQAMVPARAAGKEVINYGAAPSVAANGADLPCKLMFRRRFIGNFNVNFSKFSFLFSA
jgi:hypothetical protein